MSGQQQRNQQEHEDERQVPAQPGSQPYMNHPAPPSTSNLFNPNYRGPQYTTNASAGRRGHSHGYNGPAYNQGQGRGQHISQLGQATNLAAGRARGYPSGRGGHQGRGAGFGRVSPYTGPPNQYPQFGAGYPPQGYQQQPQGQQAIHPPPVQQYPARGTGHSRPSHFPPSAPASQRGNRPPVPPPDRPLPAPAFQPRGRPTPAGAAPSPGLPPKPFDNDDFPSLGSQPHQLSRRQQPEVDTDQSKAAASRGGRGGGGGRRGRFVAFTDYNVNSSTTPSSSQQQAPVLPPPRSRRNKAFLLSLDECYRGKIVFIDELAGLDYSGHPAVVRSIDPVTRRIQFYKKSSFKGIGGFLNKYGEYNNQSQKRWHEKQWLLVDDGITQPHHSTPLLKLAHGEKMPEKGSYVDIHGETELPIEYFSKYSRYGSFPEIYLPEDEMKKLEVYSKWYLDKDGEYRQEEEKRKKERWQMDGSADVDIGDIYEDSENETD